MKNKRTHGQSLNRKPTPESKAYHGAKQFCTNPNSNVYAHYGDRGIETRFASLEQFLADVRPRRPKVIGS